MRRSLFPQNFFALIPLCGLALLILSSRTSSAFPKIPEEEGARNLEEYAKTYSNREEWQARAKKIRAGILEGSGLNPLPRRTPLESVIHSRKEMDGYSVENVYFESSAGFFVTGNLYRPLRKGASIVSLAYSARTDTPRKAVQLSTLRCAVRLLPAWDPLYSPTTWWVGTKTTAKPTTAKTRTSSHSRLGTACAHWTSS